MSIFKRKPLSAILEEANESGKGLKRTIGIWTRIALGIGAVIGSGLFVFYGFIYFSRIINSTRLFCCRPSSVSFDTTGAELP